MNSIRRDIRSFDYILLVLVVALALFGLLMIGSATGLGNGNVSSVFINQLIFLVTGIGIMMFMAFVNYEFICKFYIPIYVVNIALLVLVLFMPDTRGVARWIGVEIGGFEFGIQPSEFAKIFMIIVLAKIMDKYRDRINNPLVIVLIFAATALPVALINMQLSFSASTVSVIIMLAMLYVGKISYKYVIVVTLVVAPVLLFFYIDLHAETPILIDDILTPWQQRRIWDFLYPEYGDGAGTWQNEQAVTAMSSGLLWGRGLFNNQIFIPEATNDFLFSVIGAELGFIGSVAVIAVALLIVLRCLMIAHRSEVFLGKLIATGVAVTMAFQAFTNTAINAWLLPNTGMNFPFVSSGGSSLWVFMAMIGLVLNVGMTREYSMFENMGHSYD
ncbi:MAG: FtsW/RodA/SpoVE family cell cycle protein [Defluviitaleaceae bacterium]|nr:FtsW/RodA/SpoVE family cell cycle protein [Defluviitaleaceae bacterium]